MPERIFVSVQRHPREHICREIIVMRMKAAFRFALYAAFGLLFATGIVWLVADQLKEGSGGDLWQQAAAWALMAHGGMTMLTLMLLGALVPSHIQRAWRAKKNRSTGLVSLALYGLLILTAFGLYYIGSEAARHWLSFVHITAGLVVPAVLSAHILVGRGILHSSATSAMPLRQIPPSISIALVPDGDATADKVSSRRQAA
jgi:small-conductance mechanosensitive channel